MKIPGLLLGALQYVLILLPLIPAQTYSDNERTLQRVLSSLDAALDFYSHIYTKANLDGIIGSRLVDGQLAVLLDRILVRHELQVPRPILRKIILVQKKAEHISDLAIPYVKANQSDYYDKIGILIQPGFWRLDFSSKSINPSLIVPPISDGEVMHEYQSDFCLTELFGTGENKGPICRISGGCWDLMTGSGYRSYSLSHEVFYLEIGKIYGCFRGRILPRIYKLIDGFCANMYQQAKEIADKGYPNDLQDLFMEHAALCGMMGYRDFVRSDWLAKILSWQKKRGCYSDMPLKDTASKDSTKTEDTTKHVRVKREERILSDGCQCHRTAVAVGALAQYVRFILEFMQLQQP